MARVYESNGPDVKIRGNPSHIAEKYIQLARDAQSSGDPSRPKITISTPSITSA